MPDLQEAVVVATGRSAIGRANKGSLVDVRADDLMADIIKAALAKVPELDPNDIVDVICGNVAQSGETGFNVARTAGILAGLPLSVPGQTVQRFCSSSLLAISTAANAIKVGEGDVYIACGVEKSSRHPQPEGQEGGGGGGRQRPAFGGPDNPTDRDPTRPSRSCPSSSPPSSPTALSRPATPARSTTAPPPCC